MAENKQPNQTAPYGKVEKGLFMRQHVGDGKTPDGKPFEICQTLSGSPLILYGNRGFSLSWNDICNMAADAGLFDEEG